ncbi:hypothetical protein GCM10027597_20180 [Saccharopolyspora tripterygii]
MPPAVPALPPPMNIRISCSRRVPGWKSATSRPLNPAVRDMTAVEKPATSLLRQGIGPKVAGLAHSAPVIPKKPTVSRSAVASRVILACRVHRRDRLRWRKISTHTGKPRPPAMTATQIGRTNQGSVAKETTVSSRNANPALLKAETAWKTPS